MKNSKVDRQENARRMPGDFPDQRIAAHNQIGRRQVGKYPTPPEVFPDHV